MNDSDNNFDDYCNVNKIFGVYTIVLFIASTFFNAFNLWIYYKSKIFIPINLFMTTLITLNLVGTILETPLIIYNSFSCK